MISNWNVQKVSLNPLNIYEVSYILHSESTSRITQRNVTWGGPAHEALTPVSSYTIWQPIWLIKSIGDRGRYLWKGY